MTREPYHIPEIDVISMKSIQETMQASSITLSAAITGQDLDAPQVVEEDWTVLFE